MMKFDERLTEDTFLMYTMKYYNNPQSNHINEYNEDISRIKYIKRLLGRYYNNKDLKERLILNHIIILGNVFGATTTTRILFYKIEEHLHSYLKTFLLFLNYIPENSKSIPEVDMENIPVNLSIIKTLRRL